jgi:hypothetical protein
MNEEWAKKIQDLIDEFPDHLYVELLEEMIDRAQIALDARREEEGE